MNMTKHLIKLVSRRIVLGVGVAFIFAGCGGKPETELDEVVTSGKLKVTTTVNMVSDLVRQVGGEHIEVTEIMNHDDTPAQISPTVTASTFVRSIYFFDPDGIQLEFAAWTREMGGEGDVRHEPATAEDRKRYLAMAKAAAGK